MGFGTTFTGNPLAPQSPGPAPGPGLLPIVYLTADADGGTWANAWQAWQQNANFIAHLQKTAKYRPPRTPNGVTGFTTVTHGGSGPANGIAPAALSSSLSQPTNTPYNFVFKITLAGAIGVAKFQYSLDGGNTYNGSDITTAATYTESTSGVTVAMTGTQVLNDTYSFSGTDTPMAGFVDSAGNNHGLVVDHNGYVGGRSRSEFREDWWGVQVIHIGNSTNAAIGRWQGYTGASGTVDSLQAPTSGYGSPYTQLTPGATLNSQSAIALAAGAPCFSPLTTAMVLCLEFDFSVSAVGGASKMTTFVGLASTVNPWSSGDQLLFGLASGGTQMFASYGQSGSITQSLVNFFPTGSSAPNVRARIEYYGSASPLGNAARFFINGNLVWTATTSLPTAQLFPFFAGLCGVTGNGVSLYVGSVVANWNRWPNPELV